MAFTTDNNICHNWLLFHTVDFKYSLVDVLADEVDVLVMTGAIVCDTVTCGGQSRYCRSSGYGTSSG